MVARGPEKGPQGSNLKTMCMAAGISQADVARAAKVNAATVRAAEGSGSNVKLLTCYKILNAFNDMVAEKYMTTLEKMFPSSVGTSLEPAE